MEHTTLAYHSLLAGLLFVIGLSGVLVRRNLTRSLHVSGINAFRIHSSTRRLLTF
jgi:NADH:ubiquinone oxidoreductase subunit K